MDLYQARTELFIKIQSSKTSYKRILQQHIKSFPCDKNLGEWLRERTREQIGMKILSDDPSLFSSKATSKDPSSVSGMKKDTTSAHRTTTKTITTFPVLTESQLENLGSHDFSTFYTQFFSILFSSSTKYPSVTDVYEAMILLDQLVQNGTQNNTHFFPTMEFQFLVDHFPLSFLPVPLVEEWLVTISPTNLTGQKRLFIQRHLLLPLEAIVQERDEKKMALLMKHIFEHYPDLRKSITQCSMDDFAKMVGIAKKTKLDFIKIFREFYTCQPMVLMDTRGDTLLSPVLPRSLFKKKIHSSSFTKRASNTLLTFRKPILSILRPWISQPFHKIRMRCLSSEEHNFYAIPKTKIQHQGEDFYEAADPFHQEYIGKGGNQKGNVFTSQHGHRFLILFCSVENQFLFEQDETLFLKEQNWFANGKRPSIDCLSRMRPGVESLENPLMFWSILQKHLREALESMVDPHTDVYILTDMMMEKLKKEKQTSLKTLCNRFFHLIGRMHRSLSTVARLHVSLPFKMKNLYFKMDNFWKTPSIYLFPELFLYGAEDRALILEDWRANQKNFYQSVMKQYSLSAWGLVLLTRPFKTGSSRRLPVVQGSLTLTQIFHQGSLELLDLTKEDEGLFDDDPYLDMDMIQDGIATIGYIHPPPPFWKVVHKIEDRVQPKNSRDAVEDSQIPTQELELTVQDVYEYLEKLPQEPLLYMNASLDASLGIHQQAEEGGGDVEGEPDAQDLSEEYQLEDCLEEEEVDVDEFYGIGENDAEEE